MRESQRLEEEVLAAEEPLSAKVPPALHGQRLDAVAAALFTDFSRSRLAEWIKVGRLQRNQCAAKPRDKVAVDDLLLLTPLLLLVAGSLPGPADDLSKTSKEY